MDSQLKTKINDLGNEASKLQDLRSSYKRLSLDLIACGQHIPGEDPQSDKEMREREDRLLFAQEDILETLAQFEISSDAEAVEFANLWEELQRSEDDDLPSNHLISVFNNLLSHNSEDR